MLRNVERTIGRGRLVGAGVLVLLVAAAFYLGTTRPAVSMHTAVPASASGAISIEADGWTYSVPLDGVAWIDGHGSWHDSERPSCLPPGGTTSPVTFASVQVTVEGSTWRPVVLVDCR